MFHLSVPQFIERQLGLGIFSPKLLELRGVEHHDDHAENEDQNRAGDAYAECNFAAGLQALLQVVGVWG